MPESQVTLFKSPLTPPFAKGGNVAPYSDSPKHGRRKRQTFMGHPA
jgi:hypothetical protein